MGVPRILIGAALACAGTRALSLAIAAALTCALAFAAAVALGAALSGGRLRRAADSRLGALQRRAHLRGRHAGGGQLTKRLRRAGNASTGRCLSGCVERLRGLLHTACCRLLGRFCKRLSQRLLIHALHRVLQRLAGVALRLGHGLGKAVQPLLGQCVHGSVFAFVKQAV